MTTDFCALSYKEKLKLADNPSTPIKTLRVLATDENSDVRWWVADNPNTPVEVLKVLATDENSYVRSRVAENPNTSIKTLKVLATDEDWNVRFWVARNPSTPLEAPTLKELALEQLMDCEMHHTIELNIIRQALETLNDN